MSLDVNFPVKFPILFFVVVGLGDSGFLLIKTPSHSDHKQDFLVTYWMAKHLNPPTSRNLDYFPLSHNPHPHLIVILMGGQLSERTVQEGRNHPTAGPGVKMTHVKMPS